MDGVFYEKMFKKSHGLPDGGRCDLVLYINKRQAKTPR